MLSMHLLQVLSDVAISCPYKMDLQETQVQAHELLQQLTLLTRAALVESAMPG